MFPCRSSVTPIGTSPTTARTASTSSDSGSGWPSFVQPKTRDAVELAVDTSHGMRRVEVNCSRCGGHLGHVFDDGPGPTGERWCINSSSLALEGEAREGSELSRD